MLDCDVIIIGSGPAGVHAAWPLVQAGKKVTMIDGGKKATQILENAPDKNFEDIRRKDPKQWKWFLGENLSGIPLSGLSGGLGGGQISGNRSYVTEDADNHLPIKLENAFVIQSLAEGGLGAAWGATSAILSDSELKAMGLPVDDMHRHYDSIRQRIGVSDHWKGDLHASLMLRHYEQKRSWFEREKIRVMQPMTAVLTEDKGLRKATNYSDMDYWADPRKSVYRPQYTLDELKLHNNFTYIGASVVETIFEDAEGVSVRFRSLPDGTRSSRRGRVVILCAGAVNSARILLRSLNLYDTPTSFIGKPHVLTACLHPKTFGKPGPKERLSLCQIVVTDEMQRDGCTAGAAQLYSYRSMQLFRLLSSVPLPAPLALQFLAMLSPSLVIADIRFPALPYAANRLSLQRKNSTEDCVCVSMHKDPADLRLRHKSLKRLKKGLRTLGLLPIKTLNLEEASTSHYAGTIPFSEEPKGPISTDCNGKVHGMQHVFVADASVFRCLPPTPHTLTIMANANRIGEGVLQKL